MTLYACNTCHREFPRASAFCSRGCSDSWAQSHPRGVVPIVPVLAALAPLLVVEPPLTPEEIARAAVFVLTGLVQGVSEAVERVKQTPWPVATPDDDPAA